MKKLLIFIFSIFILIGCDKDLPILDTPLNLSIEDNILNFTEVANATHYVISINGSLTTITDNKYELTSSGFYSIKVKAQAKGYNDSDFTEEITHYIPKANEDNLNTKFIYNLKSTKDLIIYDLVIDNPTITLSDVSQDYIIYSNNLIQVKSDYLKTLSIGKYDYILTINNIPFEIEIEIIDNDNPYLMVNSNYYFNPNQDIIVRFDEMNTTLNSVSGNTLTNDDYTLKTNELILNKVFIKNYFDENPEYFIYILTFEFQKDKEVNLVRLWITKVQD